MKKLKKLLTLFAIITASVAFTGCGGDDDGGDDGGNNNPPPTQTETGTRVNAPENLAGNTYTVRTGTGLTKVITFTSGNTYQVQQAGQPTETGTFQATRDNDIYTVTTTASNGTASTVYFSFNAQGAGSYTLIRGGETPESGLFTNATGGTTNGGTTNTTNGGTTNTTNGGTTNTTDGGTTNTTDGGTTNTTDGGTTNTTDGGTTNTTDGGTTNTTDGGTTNTTDGSTTGNAPTEIPANTSFNVQVSNGAFAGSNYTVTLSGGPTGTFNIGNGATGAGSYTYSRTSGTVGRLVLTYSTPVAGEGDTMDMTFTTANNGSFTGSQRVDGGGGVFTDRTDFAGTFTNFGTPQ